MVLIGRDGEPGLSGPAGSREPAGGRAVHPCEQCRCCACQRLCMRCTTNCSPADSCFIPVISCPEFADIHILRPVRYLYRSGYGCEYRIHFPGSR
jgi:hypothetical protein